MSLAWQILFDMKGLKASNFQYLSAKYMLLILHVSKILKIKENSFFPNDLD